MIIMKRIFFSLSLSGHRIRAAAFTQKLGKHFLAGRLPRLHPIVEGRTGIRQVVEVFILAAEFALAGIAARLPVGSAPDLLTRRPGEVARPVAGYFERNRDVTPIDFYS
jgi:hypothetical protein